MGDKSPTSETIEEAILTRKYEDKQHHHSQPHSSLKKVSPLTLVLMAGFAGAGKTTLAARLHDEITKNGQPGWALLSKDELKNRHLDQGEPLEEASFNSFADLYLAIRQKAMIEGISVIVDTSNEIPTIYENIVDILQHMRQNNTPARLKIILCIANKKTRTERLEIRGSMFKPHTDELPAIRDDFDLFSSFCHLFSQDAEFSRDSTALARLEALSTHSPEELEHFEGLFGEHALIVNTSRPLDTYADAVIKKINNTWTSRDREKAEI